MSKMRIAAALVAMLLAQWSVGTLLALTTHTNGSITQTAISSFAGALTGGFIAKRNFLLPALILWALIWGTLLYILHGIGQAAGTASLSDLLNSNVSSLLLSGVAVVVGATIGQKVSNHSRIATAT